MSDSSQLTVSVALLGAAIALITRLRYADQLVRDTNRLTYRLSHPRDLTAAQVADFLLALTRLRPSRGWLFGRDSVVFELIGTAGRIEHRLRLPDHEADVLLRQLAAIVPGVRAELIERPALPRPDWLRRIRLTTTLRPLRTDVAEVFAAALLSTLQPLAADETLVSRAGETLIFQLVVFPVRTPSARLSMRFGSSSWPSWLGGLGRLLTGAPRPIYDRQAVADFEAKVAAPWFGVVGLVAASAASKGRAHLLVGRVMASLHRLDQDGVELVPRWQPAAAAGWLVRGATRLWVAIYLNAQELATLVAWPVGGPVLPGLRLRGGRALPPSADIPATGRILGRAVFDSYERPVAVAPADTLMHQLVTGSTGTGKSTLLLNELTQDFQAGRGVVLIDPGGDLARDAIDRIPSERLRDLIYLDAANPQPVGLNPLRCEPADAELVADQVLQTIKGNASGSWGPRLEEILRNALVLLAACSDTTLVDLRPALTDRRFRGRLLQQLPHSLVATVGAFFNRFDDWSEAEREQAIPAVLNKVSPLTDRRSLRAILGQAEPRWTIQDVIDHRKILIVALPDGVVGAPAADLLGGLIVRMVWNAALRRSARDRSQRQPAMLYIDEVARFLRSDANLADLLARARGHGLGLVAALQHLGQAPPALRTALLSEARTKVAFQAGPDDAATLARSFGPPVTPDDLLTLQAHTALAAVAAAGQVQPAVTIATNPPPAAVGLGARARSLSATTFGRAAADIEAEIAARHAPFRLPNRPRTQIPAD